MSYLDKVIERRDAVKTEMDAVLEAVAAENRTDLTAEETEKVDALVEESRSLDTKIEKMKRLWSSTSEEEHLTCQYSKWMWTKWVEILK